MVPCSSAASSANRHCVGSACSPSALVDAIDRTPIPYLPAICLYGVLDPETGHFRFANAGHDLPYVKTAEGSEELRARGMPLGLMLDAVAIGMRSCTGRICNAASRSVNQSES